MTVRVPTRTRAVLVAILVAFALPSSLPAANAYIKHNLVSDIQGLADHTDPNLINPWGIATSPTSPFWFADAGSGKSTLYSTAGSGSIPGLVVTVPPYGNAMVGSPTGIVFNGGTGFEVAAGKSAAFIFATQDGTISGWNSSVNQTNAIIMVQTTSGNAVYKGLALAANGSANYLYAANFYAGTIDVFDSTWTQVKNAGAFTDPNLPAGFAPFNIQNLGGNLYVTYAKQNDAKNADVSGPGNGFVDVYDPTGKLMQRLISRGWLNSPWGVAIAPAGFGDYAGDLLVGNFGDGIINVFNLSTGAYVASLQDVEGNPYVIEGLWALQPGNGHNGGDANAIYFTAGIGGPNGTVQSHGLFGSLQAAPSTTSGKIVNAASFQPTISPYTFVTITGANLASTTRNWQSSDFVNGRLPTELDGVSVDINGAPAYVSYISPTQINLLLPSFISPGPLQVVTMNNGLTSGQVTAQLQALSPAFFPFVDGTHVAATHADGTPVGPTSLYPNLSTPAKPGEVVTLWGTGFGPTTPEVPDGQVIGMAYNYTTMPTVFIGGATATVSFAGVTEAGLAQVNVMIPNSTPDGDASVAAQIGSTSTPTNLVIAVQH